MIYHDSLFSELMKKEFGKFLPHCGKYPIESLTSIIWLSNECLNMLHTQPLDCLHQIGRVCWQSC